MKKKKNSMDRRTFLKTTTLGSASLALSAGLADKIGAVEAEKSTASKEIPTRVLGKTGISVPILAMGGDDWTTNQSLLRIAFQMGVTFWDAASEYENGKCELGIGQYFEKYPEDREKVFLVTKASRTVDPKEMSNLLTQSLERMRTDYIDLFTMHGIESPDVLTPDIKAWAEQKKKEGKIRSFGFTSHANVGPLLMSAAKYDWIDAVNTSYNYQLLKEDDVKRGMEAIAKAKIGFIAMKTQAAHFTGGPRNMPEGREGGPQGPGGGFPPGQEGRQAGPGESPQGPPPEMQAQAADDQPEDLSAMSHFIEKGYTLEQAKLKLLWEDERVTTCLSKMSNVTILKDNVAAATDNRKLSSLDKKVLDRLAEKTRSFYCMACKRCDSVMLSESGIPNVLRYMMYYNSYGERDEARALFRNLPENIRRAMSSTDYSRAERVCPHGIKIGSAMKEAVRLLA
jgi:predicted aldo/keto reductase-like oxidoreductase